MRSDRSCTVSALTKLDLHHSATYAFDVAAVDPATAGILSAILRPVLSIASLLMIVRIVLTWYPEVDATKMPWAIAYAPTGQSSQFTINTFTFSFLMRYIHTPLRALKHHYFLFLLNATESLLAATRKVVKPFNGLDVSPIVWVALLSFVSEILTGPQGILSLLQRKGI